MLLPKKVSNDDIYNKGNDMSKFGLYTKSTNESGGYISVVDMPSTQQAEAYFAGVKQLSIVELKNIFEVREVKTDSKNLLLG